MQLNQKIDYTEEIDRDELAHFFQSVRQQTESLCHSLIIEDYVIQGMPDVSPPKWHLAHTTWFFETFILANLKNYQAFNPSYHHLFNSYYLGINNPYPRCNRGLLSRPAVEEIYSYRQHVDNLILNVINQATYNDLKKIHSLISLGLAHEQQHQELLLMDIKYNFSLHSEPTTYFKPKNSFKLSSANLPMTFTEVAGSVFTMGYQGQSFCFDNELPSHQKLVADYAIANRLVTNGEYLDFILAGGYKNPVLWLSDGWTWVQNNAITQPLYWVFMDNLWYEFSLLGLRPLNLGDPVAHISYFEADAYARWQCCRLPTEEEWEYFVTHNQLLLTGNFLEQGIYHPQPVTAPNKAHGVSQFFGDLWEWTASPYSAYPQYKPFAGSIGEYNGKFMNNQYVLRGGCCITPQAHIRKTYRNFYQPEKRWQFSGIRLARDC
ncbi:methyltransferase [Legionella beliardensis]|uniref:Methyltransferase n=1 Tax=Legionella beliardensis TaxID=91822 RepID=A0A378HZ50_9GAMM|nr:ergothioneine biosynthesis protein EgtB [Legionella beliardensis]STX28199.1 methyltransferase [Legionella beliardensis]